MRKIIRLTESDLARIVRRVIREDATAVANNGTKAFQLIKSGMAGLGTDEAKVQTGVFTIKNKTDYDTCLALVKKEGYNTIMKYIATDMAIEPDTYDSDGQRLSGGPIQALRGGTDNKMLYSFEKYLKQFNSLEKVQY